MPALARLRAGSDPENFQQASQLCSAIIGNFNDATPLPFGEDTHVSSQAFGELAADFVGGSMDWSRLSSVR